MADIVDTLIAGVVAEARQRAESFARGTRHRYTFIEPERPAGPSLRDRLSQSLDQVEVSAVMSDAGAAISDAASVVLDATDPQLVAAGFRAAKKAVAGLLLAIAAFENGGSS